MMLYTIIPEELIYNQSSSTHNEKYFEIEYMGEKVEVSALTNNDFIINRLISTSPQAYLNPGFQPGTIIRGNINMKS